MYNYPLVIHYFLQYLLMTDHYYKVLPINLIIK